jgi:hypothetical protein
MRGHAVCCWPTNLDPRERARWQKMDEATQHRNTHSMISSLRAKSIGQAMPMSTADDYSDRIAVVQFTSMVVCHLVPSNSPLQTSSCLRCTPNVIPKLMLMQAADESIPWFV